jgi:hypothetical protein
MSALLPVSNKMRLPPYSMNAENPQSFLIVEVLPKASYSTVICAVLDCAYAADAPIGDTEINITATVERICRVIA